MLVVIHLFDLIHWFDIAPVWHSPVRCLYSWQCHMLIVTDYAKLHHMIGGQGSKGTEWSHCDSCGRRLVDWARFAWFCSFVVVFCFLQCVNGSCVLLLIYDGDVLVVRLVLPFERKLWRKCFMVSIVNSSFVVSFLHGQQGIRVFFWGLNDFLKILTANHQCGYCINNVINIKWRVQNVALKCDVDNCLIAQCLMFNAQSAPGYIRAMSVASAITHIIMLMIIVLFSVFLHSSIGWVAYVTVFNSSATWAATFHLWGYKCMLDIFMFPFMFPQSTKLWHGLQDL